MFDFYLPLFNEVTRSCSRKYDCHALTKLNMTAEITSPHGFLIFDLRFLIFDFGSSILDF